VMILHTNREGSGLVGESSEESAQFHFIRASCLGNLKGSIGLMLPKVSDMRVTIPLDLSTRYLFIMFMIGSGIRNKRPDGKYCI
jgi:hypothetical protein